MAKKVKGNRVQVVLECAEHKESGLPGTSRYITTKNKKKTQQLDWNLKNTIPS
jgi:large subunit ribosomal protein L33